MNETGKPSSWAISATCWCDPDLVRRDVLEHEPRMGGGLRRAAGAGHPRHRVDDDARRVDRCGKGAEREQHRGRVAARVRDQPSLGRRQLGEPVRPVAELVGPRVREAVPLLVLRRVREPVRAGEVDHDPARGRLERRGVLVREAEEGDVGLARERRVVRDEPRDRACRRSGSAADPVRSRPARRASPSRRRRARARGDGGRGRASPGRCSRRQPTMLTYGIRIVCMKNRVYASRP